MKLFGLFSVLLALDVVLADPTCSSSTLNVALNKPATMSSKFNHGSVNVDASNGNEGNANQDLIGGHACFHTNSQTNPWWRVDLEKSYMITEVEMFNRNDGSMHRARDIELTVGESLNSMQVVGSHGGNIGNDAKITLDSPIVGRYVQLTLVGHDFFHLCEVRVYGYEVNNVALNKPAYVSSPYGDAVASRGNDGNYNQNYFGESCFHTDLNTNPWWRVDLEDVYIINTIVLYNRVDCCGDRAHDVEVTLGMSLDNMQSVGIMSGNVGNTRTFSLQQPGFGRYVQLTVIGTEYFHLCEVEIIGNPVTDKPCQICGCQNGEEQCLDKPCDEPDCPEEQWVEKEGECCLTCIELTTGGCMDDELGFIPNGPFGDKCEGCTCMDGTITCSPVCEQPVECVDAVVGSCGCHECPNGQTCNHPTKKGTVLKLGEPQKFQSKRKKGGQICMCSPYGWFPTALCTPLNVREKMVFSKIKNFKKVIADYKANY